MLYLFVLTRVSIYGVILILTGAFLRLWIGKRRFDRRGVAGLQHYRSYWAGLIISAVEILLALASVLMMTSGLVLVLIEWYNYG